MYRPSQIRKIIQLLEDDGVATTREIATMLGASLATTRARLADLRRLGVAQVYGRVGGKGTGGMNYWELR